MAIRKCKKNKHLSFKKLAERIRTQPDYFQTDIVQVDVNGDRYTVNALSRDKHGDLYLRTNPRKEDIYMITLIEKINFPTKGSGDFGKTERLGYFRNRGDAFGTIRNPHYIGQEKTYPYAVIEQINEGVGSIVGPAQRTFLKYDTEIGIYKEIDAPERTRYMFNIFN